MGVVHILYIAACHPATRPTPTP